jgi:CubicO group peptidase (beta-lactamase class C family)
MGYIDRLGVVLAPNTPAWEPGLRQAYHALTLGFYEGELLRRLDPQRRSLGQFFQDEIAAPLGLDVYIRLPEGIGNERLAVMTSPGWLKRMFGFPLRFTLEAVNPRSNIYRALVVNPGAGVCLDEQRVYARNLEVPSGGPWGPPGRSRGPTAFSPPVGASCGCARRRSICWPRPRSLRGTDSTTSA